MLWSLVAPGYPPIPLNAGGQPSLAQLLFGAGENGFLIGNFAETDELFQSPAGLAAVVSDGNPVGVALDDRLWGSSSYATILAASTELFPDGGMTSTTDWTPSNCTLSIEANGLRLTSTISMAGARTAYKTLTGLTVGTAYRVAVEVTGRGGTSGTSTTNRLSVRTTLDADVLTSPNNGNLDTKAVIFVATATSHRIQVRWDLSGGDTTTYVEFDNLTVKAVSGNHAVNATGTQCPVWQSNSGKPYLGLDGTDDRLAVPYIPNSAGTIAAAFRASNFCYVMAGGQTTGNKRLRISVASPTGYPSVCINTSTDNNLAAVDCRNVDTVIAVTWDATGWEAWLSMGGAAPALAASAATVPLFDGTGNGFKLGAIEDGTSSYPNGRMSAALARSVRSTPALMARICNDFVGTF